MSVEAAPFIADQSELVVGLRALAIMLGDLYPNSRYGPLCTDAADALSRSSRPVQVEVTDELVERAAVAMYFEDCGNTPDARERSTDEFDARFRQMARACLTAVLGSDS